MSGAYKGGSETFRDVSVPKTEREVRELLAKFIQNEFRMKEAANEVLENDDKSIIMFADDDEDQSPATRGSNPTGELVVYGSIAYRARNHSVQTIWENKFEVRERENGIYVRMTNWFGPTVGTWDKKVTQNKLWR